MKPAATAKKTVATPNRFKNGVVSPMVAKPQTRTEKTSVTKKEVSLQKIQEKAYELFLKRNGGPGSAQQDWIDEQQDLVT